MRHFNPHSPEAARAVQAWQILVGCAMNRQTATYESLSRLMFGKPAAGVLARILGHVALFCRQNGLPPLSVIVVNASTGLPGEEIPVELTKLNEFREQIYQYDWFDVAPPAEDELRLAYQNRLHSETSP